MNELNSQEPEHPPPGRQLRQQPSDNTAACRTHRGTAHEQRHRNVPPEPRRECDTQERNAVRDHDSTAYTCQRAEHAQHDEVGRKASADRERDPKDGADEEHIFVPPYCAEAAAGKDECSLC